MQNRTKILKNVDWQLVFKVIKWLVPACMALVLYKKFLKNPNFSPEVLLQAIRSLDFYWLPVLLLLSFINWGIETRKWQYLICKLELQSFKVAYKSVLCGVTVAQMLPYRTGEYLGRLAYVNDDNKVSAGVLSIIGSFTQLLITLIFGSVAFMVIQPLEVPYTFILYLSILLALLVLGYFHLPQLSFIRNHPIALAVNEALKVLNKRDIGRLIGFSLLRYLVFVVPYAVLLMVFGLDKSQGFLNAALSVSCIYLLQTVSPNFILTDLAVRISVPALVLSGSFVSISGIEFIPGMIIYLFNVLLPMLAGAVVLLTLRLKK